jgi:hypothetical protein
MQVYTLLNNSKGRMVEGRNYSGSSALLVDDPLLSAQAAEAMLKAFAAQNACRDAGSTHYSDEGYFAEQVGVLSQKALFGFRIPYCSSIVIGTAIQYRMRRAVPVRLNNPLHAIERKNHAGAYP